MRGSRPKTRCSRAAALVGAADRSSTSAGPCASGCCPTPGRGRPGPLQSPGLPWSCPRPMEPMMRRRGPSVTPFCRFGVGAVRHTGWPYPCPAWDTETTVTPTTTSTAPQHDPWREPLHASQEDPGQDDAEQRVGAGHRRHDDDRGLSQGQVEEGDATNRGQSGQDRPHVGLGLCSFLLSPCLGRSQC